MTSHITTLQSLREQRLTTLREAWVLRGVQRSSYYPLLRNLIAEVRSLDLAISYAALHEVYYDVLSALSFYGNPESYFAIGIFPDPPCGDFVQDYSETDLGFKPGRRAREALERLHSALERHYK